MAGAGCMAFATDTACVVGLRHGLCLAGGMACMGRAGCNCLRLVADFMACAAPMACADPAVCASMACTDSMAGAGLPASDCVACHAPNAWLT